MASSDAVQRCLQLLEILSGEADGLALVEIARQLDLPKSNAHRLLASMVASGFVKQDPASQQYLLTLRLTTLGFRFLTETRVIDLCQPVLDRLAARTAELVRMTITEGERIAWVAKAQGSRTGLRFDPQMGREVRVHTTASGRVWLAGTSTEFALRVLMNQGFGDPAEVGPNAPMTVEDFLAALKQTREWGYGLAVDEDEPGMSAIAVPISRRADAPPVGTVSVAGPSARMTREKLVAFLPELRAAAAELAGIWSFVRLAHEQPVYRQIEGVRAAPQAASKQEASPDL